MQGSPSAELECIDLLQRHRWAAAVAQREMAVHGAMLQSWDAGVAHSSAGALV